MIPKIKVGRWDCEWIMKSVIMTNVFQEYINTNTCIVCIIQNSHLNLIWKRIIELLRQDFEEVN